MEWIEANATALQLALTMLSAVVWLAYLHILYMGFLRQRQAVVMIHHGAAEDDRARCIVSNMGSEPIYVIAVLARLEIAGRKDVHASVTDREEIAFDTLDDPLKRTNQGPLKSGEYVDIGSFSDLVYRARQRNGITEEVEVGAVEITVGAASGHATNLVVANRIFRRDKVEEGRARYVPKTLLTKQVRGSWSHRRLRKRLGLAQADAA